MAQARHRSVSCLVLIKLRRVYSRSKKTVKSEFYHFSGYASGFHPSRFPLACERAPPLALPFGVRAGSAPRAARWRASGFHPSRCPLACERAPPLAPPAPLQLMSSHDRRTLSCPFNPGSGWA